MDYVAYGISEIIGHLVTGGCARDRAGTGRLSQETGRIKIVVDGPQPSGRVGERGRTRALLVS